MVILHSHSLSMVMVLLMVLLHGHSLMMVTGLLMVILHSHSLLMVTGLLMVILHSHSLLMVMLMVIQCKHHHLRNSCHTSSSQGSSLNCKMSGSQCMSQSMSSRGRRRLRRQVLFPCNQEVGNLPCFCLGTNCPSNTRGSRSPYHTILRFRSCSSLNKLQNNRRTRLSGQCSSFRTSNPRNRVHRRKRSECLVRK